MDIPRDRLDIRFSRSGGPGGQNVNKVETKVEVRFVLEEADWLSQRVRSRLAELFPRRLNSEGEFVVVSSRYRSQSRNLEDCIDKLRECIERAKQRRKKRIQTRPTKASKERRLESKRRTSARKSNRRWKPDD